MHYDILMDRSKLGTCKKLLQTTNINAFKNELFKKDMMCNK